MYPAVVAMPCFFLSPRGGALGQFPSQLFLQRCFINSWPVVSAPTSATAFTDEREASRTQRRPAFLWQRERNQSLVSHRSCSSPRRAIQHRTGVLGSIGHTPRYLARPAVVRHSRRGSSDNDCSARFLVSIPRHTDSELRALWRLVVSMPPGHQHVRFVDVQRVKYQVYSFPRRLARRR